MPVEIKPNDERIWQYLVERTTPVTRSQIEKHFLISKSNANRALSYFVSQGIAEVIKVGNQRFYRVKE